MAGGGERALAPAEAADRLRDGGEAWQLLDVRTPKERAAARIEPSVHIELTELSARAGAELDQRRPLLVYCHSGVRSAMAVAALRAAGYDARNLTGGIEAWEAAGLPLASGS